MPVRTLSDRRRKALQSFTGKNDEAITLYRYKPSLFALYPRPYGEADFPCDMSAKRLLIRFFFGYRIYCLIDENQRLIGYESIKKNYPLFPRRYRFAALSDVFSDNYIRPDYRGMGYAKLLTRSIIEDPETKWKGFWGLIKPDNAPSRHEAAAVGFSRVGYVRDKGFFCRKTDTPDDAQSFELWYLRRE